MKIDRMRKGQREALKKIEEIVDRNEKQTGSIVLPTRYGKSDVIRVSSITTRESGLTCGSIILCTEAPLVTQMCHADKLRDMFDRYEIPRRGELTFRAITESNEEGGLFPNGEVAICMTVQRVIVDQDNLLRRIRAERRETGRRVLIHIDEGHMYASAQTWGEFVEVLVDAGCVVFLHTATPWRADGDKIPGFEWSVEATRTQKVHVPREPKSVEEKLEGKRVVDTYHNEQEKIRLDADYELTFSKAYLEGALCRLQWDQLEVQLTTTISGDADEDRWVRDISKGEVKKLYRKILTNKATIEKGVEMLVEALDRYPRRTQAIVFSAIDIGSDGESGEFRFDHHAQHIKTLVKLHTNRRAIIITGNSEDKDESLDRFIDGDFDIAIFKNMGGRGLDLPSVKIVADFSPVRTASSLVQRVMRAATPWEHKKDEWINHCSVVLLNDVQSSEIWDARIREVGGDYDDWVTSRSELVDSKPVKDSDDDDRLRTEVDSAIRGDSKFSTGETVSPDSRYLHEARRLSAFLNETAESIAAAMERADKLEEAESPSGVEEVVDIGKVVKTLREAVVSLARLYGRLMQKHTGSEQHSDTERHFSYAHRTMREYAGVQRGVKLGRVKDKKKLEAMISRGNELIKRARDQ